MLTPEEIKAVLSASDNSGKVEIYGHGRRCPIKDAPLIMWCFDRLQPRFSKAFRTRCINEFLDKYEDLLHRVEAFELLEYFSKQVTEKQRDARKQRMALTEAKAELNLAHWQAQRERREKEKRFLAKMRGDVCLN